MAKLTETQKDARALRDLYATRHPLTTWGFIWRFVALAIWLVTIVVRIIWGIPPTWLTPVFSAMFIMVCREIYDGLRRRRFEHWQDEQVIKKINNE